MKFGGGESCRVCSKRVYFAEQVKSYGHFYHKTCFQCDSCTRRLNPGEHLSRKDKPYCRTCHTELFGPTGFRGGSTGGLMSVHLPSKISRVYKKPEPIKKTEIETEEKDELTRLEMKHEDKPVDESRAMSASFAETPSHLNAVPLKTSKRSTVLKSSTSSSPYSADRNNCRTCSKPVYFAEQVKSFQSFYHRTCFKCNTCRKRLTIGENLSKGNQPYCKTCYTRQFGPHGFRGGVTGGLMGVSLPPSTKND
mmetsp:Transcript_4421/g.5127  ORF Transcript_4421/g.5127 Transcript_4421/m.5127 type:complete len:251 (-) Transcript_4421:248-1000(-)